MSSTKKTGENPKAHFILLLFSVFVLAFAGCEIPMLENPGRPGSSDGTGDTFVDGYNKTYMDANNLTQADIVRMMIETDKQNGANDAVTRAIDANGTDLFNILTNFSNYFYFYVEENRDLNDNLTSVNARIGLNTDLLATPLSEVNRRVKDTRYNKVDISNFSIEKLENQFIYLKGRIHVRSYTDLPFGGLLKIVDKEGDIKVKLELLYKESTNGVGYAYAITSVDLDRELIDYILGVFFVIVPPIGVPGVIINEYVRYKVVQGVTDDGRDSYYAEIGKYIDPEYFTIMAPTSSDPWVYLNFRVTQKGIDILRTLVTILKISPPLPFVHIQNKYTKVYASADAMLSNVVSNGVDYTNTNYGSYAYFMASSWTYQGRKGDTRSLMMFPTSSIPGSVKSAYLYLFGTGGHNPLTSSNACYIQRVTSSWSESTVTWNNQPTTSTTSQVHVDQITNPDANLVVNLTTFVQRWKLSIPILGWNNYGFMLRLQSENYYAQTQFGSRNHTDASKRPYLLVRYAVSTTTN